MTNQLEARRTSRGARMLAVCAAGTVLAAGGAFGVAPASAAESPAPAAQTTTVRGTGQRVADPPSGISASAAQACWQWGPKTFTKTTKILGLNVSPYKFTQTVQWCASGGKVTKVMMNDCYGKPILPLVTGGRCTKTRGGLGFSSVYVSDRWSFTGSVVVNGIKFSLTNKPHTDLNFSAKGGVTGTVYYT